MKASGFNKPVYILPFENRYREFVDTFEGKR
jgi:hypothetical protein